MSLTVPNYVLKEIRSDLEKSPEDREAAELAKVVDPVAGPLESCSCSTCQRACLHKPGWFAPGEAELAADYLGLTLQEFFDTYLAADYWPELDGEPQVYVLSPTVTYIPAGTRFAYWQSGQCVFFRNGRCRIHSVKPLECREQHHERTPDERHAAHRHLKELWEPGEHQRQIADLCGGGV